MPNELVIIKHLCMYVCMYEKVAASASTTNSSIKFNTIQFAICTNADRHKSTHTHLYICMLLMATRLTSYKSAQPDSLLLANRLIIQA